MVSLNHFHLLRCFTYSLFIKGNHLFKKNIVIIIFFPLPLPPKSKCLGRLAPLMTLTVHTLSFKQFQFKFWFFLLGSCPPSKTKPWRSFIPPNFFSMNQFGFFGPNWPNCCFPIFPPSFPALLFCSVWAFWKFCTFFSRWIWTRLSPGTSQFHALFVSLF